MQYLDLLNSSFLLLDLYKRGPCFMFGSSPELAKTKGKLASKLSMVAELRFWWLPCLFFAFA